MIPRRLIPVLLPATLLAGITAQQPAARAVQGVRAQREKVEKKSILQAEVLALQSAQLVPQVTGQLMEITAAEGALVEGPRPLVRLACPDLVAAHQIAAAQQQEAAADVDVAKGALEAARQAVTATEARAAAQGTMVAAAAVARDLAALNLQRAEKLHAREAETLVVLEQKQLEAKSMEAAYDSASAALSAAKAAVLEVRAGVKVRQAELARAQAGVLTATARTEHARVLADFATLTNPYPRARVTRQLMDPGSLVRADETAVLEVMDVSKVRIRFGVPDVDAASVTAGTEVRIVRPQSAEPDIVAPITRTTRAVETGSRAMAAEVELDNRDGHWLPGTLCQVEVTVVARPAATTIPLDAVGKQGTETFAWVARNDLAARVPLRLGARFTIRRGRKTQRRVEVLDGLQPGDVVLLEGTAGLSAGEPVALTVREG